MSDRLDLPEDTLAQVDEYLGHVEDGRWVCVWRDAYGIEYDASEDMRALHARVRDLGADNERLQTLCGNLAKTGGKHAHEEARLRGRVAELEAQAEVAAAERRHRRAASQMGIFESTDGGQTWRHVGDREEYDASYRALVIARAAAEKGER